MPVNIYSVGSILLALIGVALFLFALFGDRSRGRRRCPKCWYDLSAVTTMCCAECGYEASNEHDLHRVRYRRLLVLLALVGLLSAGVLATVPKVKRDGLLSLMPTSALIASLEPTESTAVLTEIERRLEQWDPGMHWPSVDYDALSESQWNTLVIACCDIVNDDNNAELTRRALWIITDYPFHLYDPPPEVPSTFATTIRGRKSDHAAICIAYLEDIVTAYGAKAQSAVGACVELMQDFENLDGALQNALIGAAITANEAIANALFPEFIRLARDHEDPVVRHSAISALPMALEHDELRDDVLMVLHDRLNDEYEIVNKKARSLLEFDAMERQYDLDDALDSHEEFELAP